MRSSLVLAALFAPTAALAQTPPAEPITSASEGSAEGTSRTASRAAVTLSGYVEAVLSFNFELPWNDVTAYRAFDNRHNTFTISNTVLDAAWSLSRVSGRLALQVGHTPETYYLAEPERRAVAGGDATSASVWKYLQQAYVGWNAPVGRGLLLEAGLFLSPIGPEGMAVKDQWNWSRSNLFFGLPFYHTGLRATYPLSDRTTATLAVFNGWNSVTDNNDEYSLMAQVTYNLPSRLTVSGLYLGGVERPPGAPEGRAWRHLADLWATWHASRVISLIAHANAGVEVNTFGTSAWGAGAAYVRARASAWLSLSARQDVFYEAAPTGATPLFWLLADGHGWVASSTVTADARPHENVSMRLELRVDRSENPMYFTRTQSLDAAGAAVPTARTQRTITLGMTTWF